MPSIVTKRVNGLPSASQAEVEQAESAAAAAVAAAAAASASASAAASSQSAAASSASAASTSASTASSAADDAADSAEDAADHLDSIEALSDLIEVTAAEATDAIRSVSTKTASDVARLADSARYVEMNVAEANVYTVPPNSELAFPVGATLKVTQLGAGATTIAPGLGVTLRSRASRLAMEISARLGQVELYQRAADDWIVSGDLTEDAETGDYFVDSVNGSDSNNGTSAATSKQNLSALPSLSNGQTVRLARGSTWRGASQFINEPSRTSVSVKAYGHGARPIIDCSTVLTGFVAGAEPNVYKKTSVALSGSGTHYTHVQWNGIILQGETSEANCSAQAGSFYITAQSGTVDIYVHAPGSIDLSAAYDGEVAYCARESAITLGNSATVLGIDTRNPRSNNGSIVVGDNSIVRYCAARNGGKHNMLAGFGSQVEFNEILEAHNHVESGIPVVIFSSAAPGGTVHSYVQHNVFKMRGQYASPTNQSCTYCHTSSGTVTGNYYVRWNTYIDVFGALSAGAANISGSLIWSYNYVTISDGYTTLPYQFANPYIYTGAAQCVGNKIWFPEPWATTFTASDVLFNCVDALTFDDNEIYTGPYFNFIVGGLGGAPAITARDNKASAPAAAFVRLQVNSSVITELSGNVAGMGSRVVDVIDTGVVVGTIEDNHWPTGGFRIRNADKTWAEWVALGYDTGSDAGGDNRACGRPRTDEATTNLSEWPNCWLHINAQDTGSITQSGGFVSAVADLGRGGRNLVLHTPDTGADKVSYSTQGGKSYFAPVGAGGLKLASQDYSMQIGVFAVVIRLNAALSPASSLQTLMSFAAGDASGAVKLGAISAAFTNEVVTFQSGGNNGLSYGDTGSYAENTPHLIVAYRDPVTGNSLIRVDGVAVATLNNVSHSSTFLVGGSKGAVLMLMRGITTANSLGGYLGELFLAGPCSLDAIEDIEDQMMERWGIA